MGLESSITRVSDLNASWPLSTDERSQGDDHLRNIKVALLSLLVNPVTQLNLQYTLGALVQFTASGTWTRPAGCRAVLAIAIGQGAGGGGGGSVTGGGGGGGGGCSIGLISVASKATIPVVIGQKGLGGTAGSGGTSNVTPTSFDVLIARTGLPGTQGSPSSVVGPYGGGGGISEGGDLNFTGAPGAPGASWDCGGNGGASFFGGAGMGQGGGWETARSAGGGGGGGTVGQTGGDGYNGLVVILELY